MPARQSRIHETLRREVEKSGLVSFGLFCLDKSHGTAVTNETDRQIGVLVGNAGPAMWRQFVKSEIYQDGEHDPLNRWTEQVLRPLAEQYDAKAIFPFGETLWPFQRFAVDAMGLKPSPLGMLIHPKYGLWHAYRGGLLFSTDSANYHHLSDGLNETAQPGEHPCDSCTERPCLLTCPVEAFTSEGLNVDRCTQHLDSGLAPDCMKLGCNARNACPVGLKYRYDPDQLRFHMRAYRGARA